MVETAPTTPFVVAQPNLLLEIEVVALDPPAQLGQIDHALQRDVGWQCGEPVVVRFGFTVRPLDQQPFFGCWLAPPGVVMCGANPPSGEPRAQWRVAAVSPLDLLPGTGGEFQSQRLGCDRPMRRVATQPLAGPTAARAGRRRQWCFARSPDRRGGQDARYVSPPKFADPSTQFAVVAVGRVHQC